MEPMPAPCYLGIDLGTTNSAAAVFDGETVTLVRSPQGNALTPSVVRIDARGQVTVGTKARRALETDPENTRAEFKRVMGTEHKWTFPASGLTRTPEQLAADVLRSLRADVEAQFGFLPERAMVTVPALFELPQSGATAEAAKQAGFAQVELIQEPVASALAAGWKADAGDGQWLVYDLGGGTFDASLLDSRDGFLSVVSHAGDNFLGGRDFDWAIVDHVLGTLGLSRGDEAISAGVRALKLAAEEAKIELSRLESTTLEVPASLPGGGGEITLTRAEVARLTQPIIERTLEICRDLTDQRQLSRVVLVGGPTGVPWLREMVSGWLGVPCAEGLDPMTLVAQGAALFAATTGLDARPRPKHDASRRFVLQYPPMSPTMSPHVAGRLLPASGDPRVSAVRFVRGGGEWSTGYVPLDDEGAFVVAVDLLPRRPNVFALEALADGKIVPASPESITIVQGITIGDPPLSRSIGVALAEDVVQVYVERGAPLPARRTFTHHTVETVVAGQSGSVIRIPIVQGELERAHLCRLVGTLDVSGKALTQTLPVGSPVEVTIDVDRGGRMTARAFLPTVQQVFEEVAHLLVPEATTESLRAHLSALRQRFDALKTNAFRRGAGRQVEKLGTIEQLMAEAVTDVDAVGADPDAAQKARRTLLDLDAQLDRQESDARWPEVDDDARQRLIWCSRWVAELGSPSEQALFADVQKSAETARAHKDAVELQRQLQLARQLGRAAHARHPEYWTWMFEAAASEVDSALDLPKARKLVQEGREALGRDDKPALRHAVEQLWRVLPPDAKARQAGYESGVR
jgi:molecular chaperone DnaK